MRRFCFVVFALFVATATASAQPREPLADRVKKAIDGGVKYLKVVQRASGSWEVDGDVIANAAVSHPGGKTALAILALLNAGLTSNDPSVALGLKNLRSIEPESTYACALQLLAYAEANLPEDRLRIQNNVKWLLDARVYKAGEFLGWSYTRKPSGGIADNSNTQYAVLGLWAAKQAGVAVDDKV